ncbi:MAG: hypothetical protein KC766_14330 [Myxococcales bacterium]|nr:hypothetical protein [Myxococcales bacterium]
MSWGFYALPPLRSHAERFLQTHRRYQSWRSEFALVAPSVKRAQRQVPGGDDDVVFEDLSTLTRGL